MGNITILKQMIGKPMVRKQAITSVLCSSFSLFLLIGILGVLIIIVRAGTNLTSLRVLFLLSADASNSPFQVHCRGNAPMAFSEIVLGLKQMSEQEYALAMPCFQKQIATMPAGRQQLLALQEADLNWRLGFHARACQQLQFLGGRREIIRLAQKSVERKDYEATSLYLDCIDWSLGEVSYSAAMLYRQLGIYYKEQGANADAFDAYEQAGKLYPGIWAEPYIVRSDMLWQLGQQNSAIRLLEEALARSTNATATFQLARALGLRLEEMGQLQLAYCAMQKALQVESSVSFDNAPEAWRLDLRERVMRLEEAISPGQDSNQSQSLCND